MAGNGLEDRVAAVRRFSRFYTREIGVLNEGLLGSELSLTEARLVYEIAQRPHSTATELSRALNLDPGYLSRLLKGLIARDLVERETAAEDARRNAISLTSSGTRFYASLADQARVEVRELLARCDRAGQDRIVAAMRTIERELSGEARRTPQGRARHGETVLRPPRPGDIGWVVHRHGVLYAEEYGWDWRFEALVAKVAGEFVDQYDNERDRCWIAEREGGIVGAAFVVSKTPRVAKLRLVYVEPAERGGGLGRRLVEAAMDFARTAGYARMTLWTNDVLVAARRVYETLGFELVATEPHQSFGKSLVGETWERDL